MKNIYGKTQNSVILAKYIVTFSASSDENGDNEKMQYEEIVYSDDELDPIIDRLQRRKIEYQIIEVDNSQISSIVDIEFSEVDFRNGNVELAYYNLLK